MKPIYAFLVLLTLCGLSTQPMDERKAQDSLPQSSDPAWKILGATKVTTDKKGYYLATYTPQVKALAGKPLTITGFILPLESKTEFRHFLLSKRTPTCPFCPPGEPNEVVGVWTTDPIAFTEGSIKIKGRFELMNDKDMGLFFALKDAKVLK